MPLSHDVVSSHQETSSGSSESISAFSLTEEENRQCRELAANIDLSNPTAVSTFAGDACSQSSTLTDNLLSRIRSSDSDVIGVQLNQVLEIARETNASINFDPGTFRARLYRQVINTPVIGSLAKKVVRTTRSEMDRYESASHQIEAVVQELESTFTTIQETNQLLDQNFQEVVQRNRELEIHIRAGRMALDQHLRETANMKAADNPMDAQTLEDRAAAAALLEKRIADLTVLQQSGFQALPTIRMIQANNTQLMEKFQTIRQVTIPAWKQGFVIRGALTQQQNAVGLTDAIDRTTNAMLLKNSELLHDNSVRTAKANQRLIIDPETLNKTGQMLWKTTQEVIAIRREGQSLRERSLQQLQALRDSRINTVINEGLEPPKPPVTH